MQKNALFQKLPLTAGGSFVINRYESPYFETPWHFHEEYELVYCERGFGKKIVGNNFSSYQQGDLAFIGRNVPHLFKADDSYYQPGVTVKPSSVVLQFREDFLGAGFFNSAEMVEMKKILDLAVSGLAVLGKTREQIMQLMLEMLHLGKINRLNNLIQIFGLLSASDELMPLSLSPVIGSNASDSFRMHKVLEYALQNYKSEISIGSAAQLAHLSESAFCRYFKSRTQKSFISFIIEIRVNEACRLLKETDLSVLEICYESGFNNLSNFNRQFRLLKSQAPVEYRNAAMKM